MGPKRDGLRVRGGQEPHLRLVQTESSFEDPAAVTAEGPARLRTYDDGWSWPGHEGNDQDEVDDLLDQVIVSFRGW